MSDASGLRRFRAHWAAWHHGTVTDPRNVLIARRAGASVAEVLAVRACLLEHASASVDRGSVADFEHDVGDALLGLPDGRTAAIVDALTDRGLICGSRLAGWDATQALRDAYTGADRKRRQREKASRDVTVNPVTSAHSTVEDRRGEDRTGDTVLPSSSQADSYQQSVPSSHVTGDREIARADEERPPDALTPDLAQLIADAAPRSDPTTVYTKFCTWLQSHPSQNWRSALRTFAARERFDESQWARRKSADGSIAIDVASILPDLRTSR